MPRKLDEMILHDAAVGWDDADLCIVGAGAVGMALALQAAANGMRVVMVEAGPAPDVLSGGEPLGEIESVGRHHAGMSAISRSGLGGTSALWGGRCVAFDDLDFQAREHVDFSGWPIRHDDLRDYYPAARDFLNCGSVEAGTDTGEGRGQAVSASAIERWSRSPDIGKAHGRRVRRSPNIRVVTQATVSGLRLDAGGDRVIGLKLRRMGVEQELRASRYVLCCGGLGNARLLLRSQREWPGKFGGAEGALGRFYQGHLTGHIALVEFADRTAEAATSFRRDHAGGYYRRRLRISDEVQRREKLLNAVFWPEALSVADPAHASGALSAIYMGLKGAGLYDLLSNGNSPRAGPAREDARRGHVGNIRRDPKLLRHLASSAWSLAGVRTRKFGILTNPARRYLLRYHAEQAPNPDSRVSLSPADDGAPMPKLSIDYRIDDRDVESVVRSNAIVDRWLRETGIGRLEYVFDGDRLESAVLDQASDGFHQIGLTRMSADRLSGVVDADCRVHDLDNLYVAGSSVFPTGGQANPTLPAVALALRLADHLRIGVRTEKNAAASREVGDPVGPVASPAQAAVHARRRSSG